MLDVLSEGFKKATEKIQGKATLDEGNVSLALADIRTSLLEADVEYGVVKGFLNKVKDKALGTKVDLKAGKMKVSAGDHFVKICLDELTELMGPENTGLDLATSRVATIMMVGLQGTGKTTTTGKLAKYLLSKKRKPLLVAADIYRPAAVKQLKVLGERVGVPVFSLEGAKPADICFHAKQRAQELGCDVVLFDTAGRLTIDEELMAELSEIKTRSKPDFTLLVCDAMMGQDAVTTAKSFNDRLTLDGVIMTKLDGDARGGAALSIKEVTGAPIKFIGMGEDLDRLEEFRPEGLAQRILGMGDIVGLMHDYERVAKENKEEDAARMLSGQFTFKDFYEQISMIQKMGSFKDIVAKLPMQNMIPKGTQFDDKELIRTRAIIDSMTEKERLHPDLLNFSRVKRIAAGSGRSANEVNTLIKRFKSMRQMMGALGKNMGGFMSKIPGMSTLSQMNQLRKLSSVEGMQEAQSMLGGTDFDSIKAGPLKRVDRDKVKKARKAAKNNRKRNRKK